MSKNINYYESSNGQAKVENDLSPIQAKLYIGAGAERKEGAGKGLTLLPTHPIFTLRRVTENMFIQSNSFKSLVSLHPYLKGLTIKTTHLSKRGYGNPCVVVSRVHIGQYVLWM